jgi:hypothetical protein
MNTQQQAYIEGFVKRANEYGFNDEQAIELLKQAKLKLTDIEDDLDMYLRDKSHKSYAKDQIDKAYANSFSLRHPYLTGIPTLGIAPANAKSNALSKIRTNMLRKFPEIEAHLNALDNRAKEEAEAAHKREMELLPLRMEEEKARARQQMIQTASMAGLEALRQYHQYRKGKNHEDPYSDQYDSPYR